MDHHLAFRQAIIEEPESNDLRLIYADWLEDNGNEQQRARAEFIRLQIASAALETGFRRYRNTEREFELLKKFGHTWRAELPHRGGTTYHPFRRGFISGVCFDRWRFFRRSAVRVFEMTPIRHLAIRGLDDDTLAMLLERPELSHLRVLELKTALLRWASLEAIRDHPSLSEVQTIVELPKWADLTSRTRQVGSSRILFRHHG